MANTRCFACTLALASLVLLAIGSAGSGQEAAEPAREAPWAEILGGPPGRVGLPAQAAVVRGPGPGARDCPAREPTPVRGDALPVLAAQRRVRRAAEGRRRGAGGDPAALRERAAGDDPQGGPAPLAGGRLPGPRPDLVGLVPEPRRARLRRLRRQHGSGQSRVRFGRSARPGDEARAEPPLRPQAPGVGRRRARDGGRG